METRNHWHSCRWWVGILKWNSVPALCRLLFTELSSILRNRLKFCWCTKSCEYLLRTFCQWICRNANFIFALTFGFRFWIHFHQIKNGVGILICTKSMNGNPCALLHLWKGSLDHEDPFWREVHVVLWMCGVGLYFILLPSYCYMTVLFCDSYQGAVMNFTILILPTFAC